MRAVRRTDRPCNYWLARTLNTQLPLEEEVVSESDPEPFSYVKEMQRGVEYIRFDGMRRGQRLQYSNLPRTLKLTSSHQMPAPNAMHTERKEHPKA